MSCEVCGREIKNYGIFLGGIRCANSCHLLPIYPLRQERGRETNKAKEKTKMVDAMELRQQLVERVRDLMNNGTCLCWTEVLAVIKDDIYQLSRLTGLDSTYVGFSIIDDVEAEIADE